ncbi:MAG: TetR/AcrR family transcriptional regulator C-terminal domain-containing protein [Actinomycetota bacterium]
MTTGDRPHLSREAIAATALRLTDQDGLAGLSMRKLGAELGVEAMSLYHYVDSKDDLLDAVLDLLYAEVDLPRDLPDSEWEKAVRLGLGSFHQVLIDHQAALVLFATRPVMSAAALDVVYWSYRRFEVMGLAPAEAIDAFRFIVSFVMGHTAQEVGRLDRPEEPDVDYGYLEDDALRTFMGHLQDREESDLFASGLDLVIDGLKARYHLP